MKLIESEILHTCVRLKIELLKLQIIKTILILNLKKDITSSFFFSNIIFPLKKYLLLWNFNKEKRYHKKHIF